jgi:bla regulator protein BlaR1
MIIPEPVSASLAAPLFNHLWQSTVVLAFAWTLAILFRRNPARVRYVIWMLASLKFLVPFALLATVGERWAMPVAGRSVASAFYTAADEIGQPFQNTFNSAASAAQTRSAAHPWPALLPSVLAALWASGFIVIVTTWLVRWVRMARIARRSLPLDHGREFEALRSAEAKAGLRQTILLRSTSYAIEPGIFGILRPVLLWPSAISSQLDDAQIASIMAHEVEHVRRRDNLTSALHMLVQALFWFHPAVHWMASRLLEERERACDEKVLESSSGPATYAESILKVCAFCLEPPAPCVSGVSGSDLKLRVLRIMTQPTGSALSALRKCALATAAIGVIATPVGFGMLHAMQQTAQLVHPPVGPLPTFEVVSIKPNHDTGPRRRIRLSPTGFEMTHATLKDIIGFAYGIKGDDQLIGGPSWMSSEYFDVEAKESEADIEAGKKLSLEQRGDQIAPMVQAMLADRFAFKATIETRELPVYVMVVAKSGLKIKQVQVDPPPPPGTPPPPGSHVPRLMSSDGREWDATAFPVHNLTNWLSHFEELANRVVIDETGLTGNYDFVLKGVSMGGEFERNRQPSNDPPTSIFTALQDQLGLKLEPRKAPVEVVVVQQAEHPSPN